MLLRGKPVFAIYGFITSVMLLFFKVVKFANILHVSIILQYYYLQCDLNLQKGLLKDKEILIK